MRAWLRSLGRPPEKATASGLREDLNVGDDVLDPGPASCSGCGRPYGFDPEDDPDGAGPGRPLCGECVRNINFDTEFGG